MVSSQCFEIARVAKFPTSLSYSCVTMGRNPASQCMQLAQVYTTGHAFRAAMKVKRVSASGSERPSQTIQQRRALKWIVHVVT